MFDDFTSVDVMNLLDCDDAKDFAGEFGKNFLDVCVLI
jgi:hypothetical protein